MKAYHRSHWMDKTEEWEHMADIFISHSKADNCQINSETHQRTMMA